MAERYVGIDIGTYNIKIADIIRNKNTFEISSHTILKTPRFLTNNGRVSDDGELLALLKAEITKKKYKSKKAIVIINDSLVITRDMEMPVANSKELDRMVKLDASEYLPSDISEYTMRHKILIPACKSPTNKNYVLMTSIKSNLALDFYNILKKAGLKIVTFDVSVNSMIKYYKLVTNAGFTNSYREEKTIAMLDLGANYVKLVIFQKGNPVSQHIMNHSSQKIDILIANSLNIESEEAEELKITFGLQYLYEHTEDDFMAKTVGTIINTQVDMMLEDVYKHIQSHASKEGSSHVDEIWLVGGMSLMKGLNNYISDSFSIPCNLVEPNSVTRFSLEEIIGYADRKKMLEQFQFYVNIIGASWKGE